MSNKMEITEDIIEAQKNLSTLNVDFLAYVEKNSDSLKRSSFKLLELNDWLFTLQPWPTFVNKSTKETFQEAGVRLFNLVKRIPQRVFNNDPYKMSEYFGIPVNAVNIQLDGINDEHIDLLIGRGDFILSSTGLKCLEYNVSANLGGLQVPIWEALYLNTPIISRFIQELNVKINNENLIYLLLEHMVSGPLKKFPGNDIEINIAVSAEDYKEEDVENRSAIYLNELYEKILSSKNRSLKGKVFLCNFPDLKVVDDCVFYKDKQIHVLFEMFHGIIPPRIMSAFRAGNLCLINGPVTSLLSNKLILALLSDYEVTNVFTGEEKEIIDTYVPWSRKIRPGETTYRGEKIDCLEHYILSNRENLVLKPSVGLGGEGVCVGRKCSQELWKTAVKAAINGGNWLVQEFIDSAPGLYQCGEEGWDLHDMVWGFFIFGSRYCGAWNRVMPKKSNKGVVNCHQGATVSVIFEVD
jgi:hypothetical protein